MVNLARVDKSIDVTGSVGSRKGKVKDFVFDLPKTIKIGELKEVKIKNRSLPRDKGRKALTPGKRISKDGNVYYEYRSNRADRKGKNL